MEREGERDETRQCRRGDILGAKEGVGERDEPTTGRREEVEGEGEREVGNEERRYACGGERRKKW